jgi:ferric-dicitrate binding protein FerR (iron transport regulator)
MGSLLLMALPGVCPAQVVASPYADRAATAVHVIGRVSIIRDNVPWTIDTGALVYPKQTIVTGEDGSAVFRMPDGSTFEVFANSRFVYRSNPSNFEDLIDLLLGQVKVHIEKKLGGKPNPNRIHTPTAVISVRGTTYHVQIEDEGETTFVGVEEGIVDVQHLLMPYGEPRHLGPGDTIRVFKNAPLAQKQIDRDSIIRRALNAASDAMWVVINTPRGGGSRTPIPGGGGTTTGGGATGDTGATPPPPPPPAPPPGN